MRADDKDELACFICLEETGTPTNRLLSGVCACRTSAIHRACLEKLVNSRARRALPLDDRLQCPVCTLPFDVLHLASAVEPRRTTPSRDSLWRERLHRLFFFVGFIAVGFSLTRRLPESMYPAARLLTLVCGLALMLGSSFCLMVRRIEHRACCCRGAPNDEDIDALDDEQFYAAVVCPSRRRTRMAALGSMQRLSRRSFELAMGSSRERTRVVLLFDTASKGELRAAAQPRRSGAVGGLLRQFGGSMVIAPAPPEPAREAALAATRADEMELGSVRSSHSAHSFRLESARDTSADDVHTIELGPDSVERVLAAEARVDAATARPASATMRLDAECALERQSRE